MEYVIVEATSRAALEALVNDRLKQDWRLVGGPQIVSARYLVQAMLKPPKRA